MSRYFILLFLIIFSITLFGQNKSTPKEDRNPFFNSLLWGLSYSIHKTNSFSRATYSIHKVNSFSADFGLVKGWEEKYYLERHAKINIFGFSPEISLSETKPYYGFKLYYQYDEYLRLLVIPLPLSIRTDIIYQTDWKYQNNIKIRPGIGFSFVHLDIQLNYSFSLLHSDIFRQGLGLTFRYKGFIGRKNWSEE